MQTYLILIGIISAISCVLIMTCINNKSNQQFPRKNSLSPLQKQGLTNNQKSRLLLIVCSIFFLSLVITNIKSGKFKYMFSSSNQQNVGSSYSVIKNSNQIFYGINKNCNIKQSKNYYPYFFKYLKETQKYDQIIKNLIYKNYYEYQMIQNNTKNEYTIEKDQQIYKQNQTSQLIIYYSGQSTQFGNFLFSEIGKKICKNQFPYYLNSVQFNPIIYINLQKDKKISTQSQLMQILNLQNYQSLKYSLCKSNGIQIKKQKIKFILDDQIGYIEKQIYLKDKQQIDKLLKNRRKTYLMINNFQNILDTVLLDQEITYNIISYSQTQRNNQQIEIKNQRNNNKNAYLSNKKQLFKPYFTLFIEKLFNQLIQKCQVNVILQTQNKNSLNKLYDKWKLFKLQFKDNNQQIIDFPFSIRQWKGIIKIDLYNLVKEMINNKKQFQEKQYIIWQKFDKLFGNILGQNKNDKKVYSNAQQNIKSSHYLNYQEISFQKIDKFFQQIDKSLYPDNSDKKSNQKLQNKYLNQLNTKSKVAQHYNLLEPYQNLRKISIIYVKNNKKISIGNVKKKINLKDLQKLQTLNLVSIKNGFVELIQ